MHLFIYGLGFSFSELVGWLVGLVVFYGISMLVGYLMPNPVYTYIYDL